MTREELAEKIHWPKIIWAFGFINVTAMFPQLWSIISTQNVDGLALPMFFIYFAVQVAFSVQGYFTRDKILMWCLGLSAVMTSINIFLIISIRYFT